MKYYLIAYNGKIDLEVCNIGGKLCQLTPDDYGLILDALYEQALYHKDKYVHLEESEDYWKSIRKVAKKFERIFKDEKK